MCISFFHSTKRNISLWKCEVLLLPHLFVFTPCIAIVYAVCLLILQRAEPQELSLCQATVWFLQRY